MEIQVSVITNHVAFVVANCCTKIVRYCIDQLAVRFLKPYLTYQWRKSRLWLYYMYCCLMLDCGVLLEFTNVFVSFRAPANLLLNV